MKATSLEPSPRPLSRAFSLAGPAVLLAFLLIASWQAASASGWLARYILPSPLAILQEALKAPDVLLRHGVATASEAIAGFALGNAAALALALVVSASPLARICLYPLALISRGVPIIAIAPLIVITLGRVRPLDRCGRRAIGRLPHSHQYGAGPAGGGG